MNSRQKKSTVTPKRNISFKRKSPSEKENNGVGVQIAKISSTKKVEQLMNGMRISACKTITNVKCSFGDMSHKFRRSSLRTRSFPKVQKYDELSEQVTPVKLYTPFTFVTPSPVKSTRKRLSPKKFSFASPTGNFHKDVQQLSKDVKELERVEKSLCLRKFR